MKKHILFDNDGVLVETEPWYFRANVEILKKMHISLDEHRYKEIMIKGQSAFILAQEQNIPQEKIDQAKHDRNRLYQHYIQTEEIAISGVKEVLALLSKDYTMGIVTSARREDFELIHASRGLIDHMQFVLCSGEYGRSKPHPDPYLKGLEQLKGTKEETFVVEDSQRGLDSAVRAGIDCVIVENDFTSGHDFSQACHHIKSLEELIELF